MKKITMLISVLLLTVGITVGANSTGSNVTTETADNSVQIMHDPDVGGWG